LYRIKLTTEAVFDTITQRKAPITVTPGGDKKWETAVTWREPFFTVTGMLQRISVAIHPLISLIVTVSDLPPWGDHPHWPKKGGHTVTVTEPCSDTKGNSPTASVYRRGMHPGRAAAINNEALGVAEFA
jgi:hypothetical protein